MFSGTTPNGEQFYQFDDEKGNSYVIQKNKTTGQWEPHTNKVVGESFHSKRLAMIWLEDIERFSVVSGTTIDRGFKYHEALSGKQQILVQVNQFGEWHGYIGQVWKTYLPSEEQALVWLNEKIEIVKNSESRIGNTD